MDEPQTLAAHLVGYAQRDPLRCAVADAIQAIAGVAGGLAGLIARGPLAGRLGADQGAGGGGDTQKALDVIADQRFTAALREAPVAVLGTEEEERPVVLSAGAPLAVVIDPLDGSSNIDTNVPIGTIFGIHAATGTPDGALLQPGHRLIASGFVVYGGCTALVLTLRQGTHIFTLDPATRVFHLTQPDVQIPSGQREYAINASNYRHWDEAIRTYVDDCMAGVDGPRGGNFNMRWIASLVAEAYRILGRGGIFLYPADRRPGYERGRLRLVYEANPLALVVEQAGGAATSGETRILDLVPQSLHQRVPLIFGARSKVERVAGYYVAPPSTSERSPLFAQRGLFYHP